MAQKTIDDWLNEYGESHQNRINKIIHWVCVPTIMWSVLALLWSVRLPVSSYANLAVVLIALSLLFYARLSIPLMLGMLVISIADVAIIQWHESALTQPLWRTAIALFIAAWIFQFIGHNIEGKKPSFFKDLQFLLIGPAWLLGFIYRKTGISYSR